MGLSQRRRTGAIPVEGDLALELTDQFIARIEALMVISTPCRCATSRAPGKPPSGVRGRRRAAPLLGVPVTIKEFLQHLHGLPTTWRIGVQAISSLRKTRSPWTPKSAGAVVLGKTNVPLSLGDWQSYNDIHGATHNPWDKTRTPGSATAAAPAAGFGLVARLRHRRLFARSGAFLRGLRAQADPRACRLPRSYAAGPARLARNGRSSRYWANGDQPRPGLVARFYCRTGRGGGTTRLLLEPAAGAA